MIKIKVPTSHNNSKSLIRRLAFNTGGSSCEGIESSVVDYDSVRLLMLLGKVNASSVFGIFAGSKEFRRPEVFPTLEVSPYVLRFLFN